VPVWKRAALTLTIAIFVCLTIAVIATRLAPRMAPGRIVFETTPDPPCPFGYKMAWLAVRTRDTRRLLEVLALGPTEPSGWNTGIGTVYDDTLGASHVFVTPPVNGWTFVVGLALPHPVGRTFVDKCTPLLLDLGAEFVEVQYFFTYPLIDFFAWARVLDGKLVRAFAIGDNGIVWNKGKPTKEERDLGLKLFELRGVKGRKGDAGGEMLLHPTEDHVMRLASRWSLDPTRLDEMHKVPGLGLIALAPGRWRAERVRRSA
jgi:hypothetical protein